LSAPTQSGTKRLTADDLAQRVLCIDGLAHLFPDPGQHFDLWHGGIPWASRVRAEPCQCSLKSGLHTHLYLEGGEIHAGLSWSVDSLLHFDLDAEQLVVSGDLRA